MHELLLSAFVFAQSAAMRGTETNELTDTMSRILKRILISIAGVCCLGASAYVALWVVLFMAMAGKWPFNPLEQRSVQVELANGGRIVIEGIEDRGFGSDGFLFDASYISPGGTGRERIGSWIAHQSKADAYTPDDLVVFVNPDLKRLHVRSPAGVWKTFSMSFPGPEDSRDLSRYVAATTLSEESLAQLRHDQTEDERRYSPNAYIDSFDAARRELTVRYHTSPHITRVLALELSGDGSALTMTRITKQIAADKAAGGLHR